MEQGGANKLLEEILTRKTLAKAAQDIKENEVEDEMASWRAKRMRQMQNASKDSEPTSGMQTVSEAELLKLTVTETVVICHFFDETFDRCQTLDKHLRELSAKYSNTKIVRTKAAKAKFLSAKLGVYMLPTLVIFVEGVVKDRVVGFDRMGGADDFELSALESTMEPTGCFDFD